MGDRRGERRTFRRLAICVALALLPGPLTGQTAREEVVLRAADGVEVYGDLYRAGEGQDRGFLLLFHQGGANARAEYDPLIPRLLDEGFDILAIDQRQGGDRLGGTNRTVSHLEGGEYAYCDAYPDLEAALAYASEVAPHARPVVWGSSYSAALVFKLAAEHPERVAAVLAFSPASGDALAGCRPEEYSAGLELPLLALRPASEMTRPTTAAQLERFEADGHATYVADPGVHGSSMLNPERVDGNVEETWEVVLAFLREVPSPE